MKIFIAIVFVIGVSAGICCLVPQKQAAEVSFSEIENTYHDLNLDELQKELERVRGKLKKSSEAMSTALNREKVVLTKLIIFKKQSQL
jgi:uncharacterized protein YgiM (DUF1202 family)